MLYKLLSFGLWFLVAFGRLFVLEQSKWDTTAPWILLILEQVRKNRILFICTVCGIGVLFIQNKNDIVYVTQVGYCVYYSKLWDIAYITQAIAYCLCYIHITTSRILFILQQAMRYCLYYIDGVAIDKTSINMQITDVSRITSLIFHVKACRDAHFFFYSDLYQLVKIIVLGSAGDCDIRPDFYSYENYKPCIVDCYQFKPFWISWQSNYIRLGYGNIVDQQSVVSGTSQLPFNIAYLSLMRYENFTWEIEYPGNNTGLQDFKFIRHTNTRSMSILSVQTTRSVSLCGISYYILLIVTFIQIIYY
ncbi:hypothetical protein LOTGIDRAFT_169227 [Lottia gigantea]|uniref:Farnesoic acid O-methyl transferase domain-containing protein n=1 Tax=Lottia gigantea TaxID=225164 RepID=V3ZM67_LOTGI|nr:hypothetical protein LOTGIDRAFT_169227 [Lottia gigantea]ESO83535.1 hypothetical protein LOTGIDRAFT_169227 [Lottia gigantea]